MTTHEIRDRILDYLQRELVGPSPGFPIVQLNREEILRPQDPPRLRYSAGILFPMKVEVSNQFGADDEVVETGNDDVVVEADDTVLDESASSGVDNEQQPATESDLNLANQYLPSAMGISTLVNLPEQLRVRVSAAQYRKEKLPGFGKTSSAWFRAPLTPEPEIQLKRSDLVGPKVVIREWPVYSTDSQLGLRLHVISRPYTDSDSQSIRLLTVTLVNRNLSSTVSNDALCFFQCALEVSATNQESCFLDYPERQSTLDKEYRSLQFLYRDRKVFAVGHGCSAGWSETQGRCNCIWSEVLPRFEVKPIEHRELEDLTLSMEELANPNSETALLLCEGLAGAYQAWIEKQTDLINVDSEVPNEYREVALENIERCQKCLSRIRGGIDLLKNDPEIRTAFALTNEAMYLQQAHYELASNSIRSWSFQNGALRLTAPYQAPNYKLKNAKWRPFQLAFLLMNLVSIADPESASRKVVDLIWFPTGGGKTEAYLGLSAFAILLRRLRDSKNTGTSVLMRYTLRLLTTQQFQRAASLICACERIRLRDSERLGTEPISIGLWVGRGVTPNRHVDAVRALKELLRDGRENPFVVLACPWCGAEMGAFQAGKVWRVKGYHRLTRPVRVEFRCEDPDCPFSASSGLPLHVVDEAIYANPPSLVVGTVDKFAMLPWRPESRSLFGLNHSVAPPELIIQDELHLISGPLGSMVALYETAIEALCSTSGTKPKIVASTATIARSSDQISALYNGRETFLFPPQGLRVADSFFARENAEAPGRCYLGVFASALPSQVTAQIRVVSALLQAIKSVPVDRFVEMDPYWTLMAYFNSIRELGHAATLIRADIREYMNAMWDRQGLTDLGGKKSQRRFINRDLELTSRVQSNHIPRVLQQLFNTVEDNNGHNAVDICLATNMIQVGLDVPRLSLMAVIGQPKTTAEYIQASSRVGRREPGLVATVYNPARPRDRSHYEHFRAYHQSIYRFVEPTSITPFAVPVVERALHAVTIALARTLGNDRLRTRPNAPPPDEDLVDQIRATLVDRLTRVDNEQMEKTLIQFDYMVNEWLRVPPSKYGDFSPPDEEEPLMFPSGSERHPRWSMRPWSTPSSMRNVDATCDVNVISTYPEPD